MSLIHNNTVRSSLVTVVLDAIDGGTGPGKCVLKAGGSEVATLALNEPCFDDITNGVGTLDVTPIPEDSDATGNVSAVDSVEFQDGDAVVIHTGNNVTGIAGGGDIELSKNPIDAGDVVQITSYTYTAST